MKINVRQIPFEGLILEEEVSAASLGLDEPQFTFRHPLKIKAVVSRITNAISVSLEINAKADTVCSRCLKETEVNLDKKIQSHYQVTGPDQAIDLGPEIREEVILDCPVKPLCKTDCPGFCLKCGKDLNQEKCICKV